uniref:Cytochrome P450 n=1 Tax=Stomoxys calcitrans TaxID=35570 RepID=A0A1I8PH65_STOCA
MYLFIIALICLVWGYKSHASSKRMRDVTQNISGPYVLPLLGYVTGVLKFTPKNILASLSSLMSKHGNVVKIWALNSLFIMSADEELNEQVLASPKEMTKLTTYQLLHPWLGVGLLTSDGKKWHSRRKIITPTFHFQILEDFLKVFDTQSTILVKCLEQKADGRTAFDIQPYIGLYTLDVVVETAMGTKVNAQTNNNLVYASAVHELTELLAVRFARRYLHFDPVYAVLHPLQKLRTTKLLNTLHDFTKKVIVERRSLLEQNKGKLQSPTEDNDMGYKKRNVFLDVLLQARIDGQPLSNEDIREEVDTFMFEGHDTTGSGLSFALHLLSRHPRVQNKIFEEIKQVYGNAKGEKDITLMSLNELKYTEWVIKESLRLYPPVPLVGRKIQEDFEYKHSKLGNGIIPAGTELFLFPCLLQRDPRMFSNPNDFLPERHATIQEKSSMSTNPFSAGPRNCIGQRFAMYVMKITLLKIVEEYELLPLGENVQPIPNLVMASENGMQLGLRKRKA